MRQLAKIGTITILSGATVGYLASRLGYGSASDLIIYCPATLPETVTAKAAGKDSETSTFSTLNINGTDVTMSAGKAIVVPTASFGVLALVAGSAVAADRAFDVWGQMDV